MKKILPLLLLTPTIANAECTPSPDCTDMGYTETSCSGKFVRCPFDTSKLFCAPCDSSYQYDCTGNYTQGGIGSSCQNKYASCECVGGATFVNGNCICDYSCETIGNIVYSDQTCSSCAEEGKTAVAVIIHKSSTQRLIASINTPSMPFSADNTDISGLSNIWETAVANKDMNGFNNTQIIVNHYGTNVDTSTNAGVYCYTLSPLGFENTQGQWYLPAQGELYSYLSPNYTRLNQVWTSLNLGNFADSYRSSTEVGSSGAWYKPSFNSNSYGGSENKHINMRVSCFYNWL